MSGLPDYGTIDRSGDTDPRNISTGRVDTVGTLLHTTGGVDSLYWLLSGAARSGAPACADYLIARNGQRYKLTPDGYYPYHAGQSRLIYNKRLYEGDAISALLMGVELENTDSTLVSYEQIDSLAELIVSDPLHKGWRWPYYVLGHYEAALPVGRRSDPLGLDWGALMGRLYYRAALAGVPGLVPI